MWEGWSDIQNRRAAGWVGEDRAVGQARVDIGGRGGDGS